jgi:hypothetical protein
MAAALPLIANGIDLLVGILGAAAKIAPIIQAAQSQGRTTLTAEEWAQITGDETSAEAALSDAIAKAKALGK